MTAAKHMRTRFGEDPGPARRAGLLHDVTKALPGPEQLKLCDKYGMMLDTFERSHPKLLHAKSGAAVAGAVFGESAAVQSAICWHTTGKPDMTLLQKILLSCRLHGAEPGFPRCGTAPRSGGA